MSLCFSSEKQRQDKNSFQYFDEKNDGWDGLMMVGMFLNLLCSDIDLNRLNNRPDRQRICYERKGYPGFKFRKRTVRDGF